MYRQATRQEKSADKYSGFSGTAGISTCDKKDEGYIHGLGTVSLLNEKSRIEAENEKICAFIDAIPVRRFHKALKLYCIGCGSKTFTWDEVAGMCDETSGESLRKALDRYFKELSADVR